MPHRRTLFRNAVVLTLDPATGDLWPGEVLVEDGKITALGTDLDVDPGGAEVIDADGGILMPGFVDTHRHIWQAPLRSLSSDWTLLHYFTALHAGFSRHYRPEDTYAGNYLGTLDALNSGITTILDWSHNLATPAHSDGAVKGLVDSGARAIFAHGGGAPQWQVPSTVLHDPDLRRVREEFFATEDQLVTMAIALRGPQYATREVNRADYALARELDLRITVHVGDGDFGKEGPVRWLYDAGLMGPDVTYVHCNSIGDDEIKMIADSGGTASVAADIELSMGHGWPATGRLLEAGLRPSLSIDICSLNGGAMFGAMRTTLLTQRGLDHAASEQATGHPSPDLGVSCRDIVEFATIEGARATGLDHRIGSITPGKDADLILIRTDDISTSPTINPYGTVVFDAHPGVVDLVMVAGEFRKRDAKLVGVDDGALRRLGEDSLRYLMTQAQDDPAISGARVGGDWVPEAYEVNVKA
jgi:5-methylthioadenosine/S-adenosylhomocysteine deaminase